MTVRVLIAEDHKLVSQGLEMMLSDSEEIELVGATESAAGVIEAVKSEEIGRAHV